MSKIKGINGIPYLDLEKHVDLQVFDSLHSEICRGISTARPFIIDGNHKINLGSINPHAQGYKIQPLYEKFSHWESLADTDPLKIAGKDLNHNQLTTYLKYAFGGYDLYAHYDILEPNFETNGLSELSNHFPNLIKWIFDFKTLEIFESLHSATLFVLEAGGIPWEHFDPEVSNNEKEILSEFIHFKTDLDRPFYLFDSEQNSRTYVNTRVAWWNESDWHGGEPILRSTYTLRINGIFTDSFKKRILEQDV